MLQIDISEIDFVLDYFLLSYIAMKPYQILKKDIALRYSNMKSEFEDEYEP